MSSTTTTTQTTTTPTTNPKIPQYQPPLQSLSGPVTALLNFYTPPLDNSPPHNYVEPPTDGRPQRNFGNDSQTIKIADARGQESRFTLDTSGFALLNPTDQSQSPHNDKASAAINWDDDASIKEIYYPEVEKLLLTHVPGSPSKILIFDHTIRRVNPTAPNGRQPVTRVHIDQTTSSAAARVRLHVTDASKAAALLQQRYRIINVWRPLNGAVESHPLAFADARTVEEGDIVPVEHRYPNRNGETAAVRWSEGQEWWYWSGCGVGDGERILLQCFDSGVSGESGKEGPRVPHSAFIDPRSGIDAKPRESIEVRALVFG